MSPKALVWFGHHQSKKRRENLKNLALAARVAEAEKEDFEKFLIALD